jgi:hypothetical protein
VRSPAVLVLVFDNGAGYVCAVKPQLFRRHFCGVGGVGVGGVGVGGGRKDTAQSAKLAVMVVLALKQIFI